VRYSFPFEGALHFVPAGQQDGAYGLRVNSFDWPRFYEKLGGGVMLESMKQLAREGYDYVLIDSRTGVSDTSGVCTVQLPDELVVCFTLNRQSIYGASAAALSALRQRTNTEGLPTIKIWPLPMRIEFAEKDRLERARALARTRFGPSFTHLKPDAADVYWGAAEVPYHPYYSYEEVLAVFRDSPRETHSLLASMELIVSRLTEGAPPPPRLDDEQRAAGLQAFQDRTPENCLQEMALLGKEYERIRKSMSPGDPRTMLMTALVVRAQQLAPARGAARLAEQLFIEGTDGSRIAGVALARVEPQRGHVEIVLEAIGHSRSAFEQFHALRLGESIFAQLDATAKERVQAVINGQLHATITPRDPSRWMLAQQILGAVTRPADPVRRKQARSNTGSATTPAASNWKVMPERITTTLDDLTYTMLEVRPSSPTVTYNDPEENHGPFVASLGQHYINLPQMYRISQVLVTNRLYQRFVLAGGYVNHEFWETPRYISSFLTQDGKTAGPASWPTARAVPDGKLDHPVTGVSMLEARAFARWCNSLSHRDLWLWTLPEEELWEYTARGDAGLIYPWGDAFDPNFCNSIESGLNDTSSVTQYAEGASLFGACDMAGNVWEFVERSESPNDVCSLRGGSFRNTRHEVRSYLRLFQVPVHHRPPDFGFRLAQNFNIEANTGAGA
jgi:formylglycine-generating enzyme required for sulfatase activity